MSIKRLLFLLLSFSFILIIGCTTKEAAKVEKVQEPPVSRDYNKSFPSDSQDYGLGNLCSGEEECKEFCLNNRGRCEEYCRNNPENEFCRILFPFGVASDEDNSEREESYSEYNYFDDVSHLPSCGDKKEFFTTLPIALEGFTTIDPLGLLSPTAHTFPAPHLYFRIKREGDSFEGPVVKVPLYAPADITITKINLIHATNSLEFADDAAVHFAPCSEFKAYFDHVVDLAPKLQTAYDSASVDRCDEYTLTYKSGPVNWKKCDKNVNLKVSEGELIGYAGGGQGQAVLDLGAFDSRIEPNKYASTTRVFRTELPYNVCPLDYFSSSVSALYRPRLGGYGYSQSSNVLITSPTCGKVIQDIPNTAKGNWFAPGIDTTRFGHEPPHLALVQGHIDQDIQAFSNGDSTKNSGLDFGIYYFTPQNSGLVNRDFAQVKSDGNVYCYNTKSNYKKDEPTTIIIQLTNPETLKIEGLGTTGCGSGPWSFNNPTEFER
ncbi:hypothetical protein HY008_00515 [Candidatus Woesebacteria bacterium]|nr:hypothetical protein [Candidatus Woesebacteria bacterium]